MRTTPFEAFELKIKSYCDICNSPIFIDEPPRCFICGKKTCPACTFEIIENNYSNNPWTTPPSTFFLTSFPFIEREFLCRNCKDALKLSLRIIVGRENVKSN